MNSSLALSAVGFLIFSTILGSSHRAMADDWPQWRGPERNGISQENGLLQEWPPEGPKLLWQVKNVGAGYSTPAVAGSRVYLLANEGLEDEFAQALDVRTGERLWRTRLGKVGNPEQEPNYPTTRSTPTVDGDFVYVLGSDGDLACLEAGSGNVVWRRNLRIDFNGTPGRWAYAESPLIDGEALICTPGGKEATLVALRKNNGHVLWKSALPRGDEAAYSSIIVVETAGRRQYVQLLQNGLAGLDAKSGNLLWRYDKPVSRFNANIPTPVASGNRIYAASAGTGGGAIEVQARNGTLEIEELYFSSRYPTSIGGVMVIGDHAYGTTAQAMLCFNFATGEMIWEERALGAASMCYAEGRLYLHSEEGEVALVEASPERYRQKGRFTPPDRPARINPREKSWAFPVLANGRLYIRDHGTIWCFDVTR